MYKFYKFTWEGFLTQSYGILLPPTSSCEHIIFYDVRSSQELGVAAVQINILSKLK